MSNVKIPTETAAGKAWLEKYLHPPSVPDSTFVATPDNNISPVTTLNFETVTNIPLSGRIGVETFNINEVFFLQTTGARVISYVFVRSPTHGNGEWFQHPQFPAIVNDSYDFLHSWGADVSMQRMCYKSCTYYLNATAFNDQGTVTIAQTRPNYFTSQVTTIPPQSGVDSLEGCVFSPRHVNGEADYNAQLYDIGDISGQGVLGSFVPASPTQVQQSNPKAVTHLAREGAFVPQHWSQPTNRFYNTPDNGNGSELDLVQTFIRFISADKSEHTLRLYNTMMPDGSIPVAPTLDQCSDTAWTDFTTGYVYFSALSVSPILGQTIVSNAYITVKGVYGIEVQPCVKSAFTFFQQSPPIPDDRAIHIAAGIVHQKPDGYPSSANDFGTIAALAMRYAPKVISWLSNAFSANKTPEKKKEPVKPRPMTKPAPIRRGPVITEVSSEQWRQPRQQRQQRAPRQPAPRPSRPQQQQRRQPPRALMPPPQRPRQQQSFSTRLPRATNNSAAPSYMNSFGNNSRRNNNRY